MVSGRYQLPVLHAMAPGRGGRDGATIEEVVEAIDVVIEIGCSPASVSVRFAVDVIEAVFGDDA